MDTCQPITKTSLEQTSHLAPLSIKLKPKCSRNRQWSFPVDISETLMCTNSLS